MPDPTIQQRAQSLEPGVRVELFEVDLTPKGGDILRFHNHTTANGATITRVGPPTNEIYTAFPVKLEGLEYKSNGPLPRPHLFVSNIGSIISALLRQYDDLLDCVVTRHVTFQEYLYAIGAVTEDGYDPTQEYPQDIFIIDRRVSESNTEVEFELAAASDVEGVMLPREQYIANTCRWNYRSPECTYVGVPKQYLGTDGAIHNFGATTVGSPELYSAAATYLLYDRVYVLVNGVKVYYVSVHASNLGHALSDTDYWYRDICPKKVSDCKFHGFTILPFGGFPGTSRIPRA